MFDNLQYEEEWHCQAAIERKGNKIVMREVSQTKQSLDKLRKLINEKKLTGRGDWSYCHTINDTAFCVDCAKKLKYRCPVCGGKIAKSRDENGYSVGNAA